MIEDENNDETRVKNICIVSEGRRALSGGGGLDEWIVRVYIKDEEPEA
jgi:hypothetical protein